MIVSLVLLALLVLGALAFILRPILRGRRTARKDEERRRLIMERDLALQLLRDLEHDRQTEKLTEEDFSLQKDQAEERAIAAMRKLDELGVAEGEDPLEAMIRLERIHLQKGLRR